MLDHQWRYRAACAPPEITVRFHYGEKGYDAERAKAICSGCQVSIQCLDQAMRYEAQHRGHYRFGIWGGLTATERDRLSLEDARYAVYPEEFTELEVFSIFEEVTMAMKVRFVHKVDGFDPSEDVELSEALADHYVGHGHAIPMTETTTPAPKLAPAPATSGPPIQSTAVIKKAPAKRPAKKKAT